MRLVSDLLIKRAFWILDSLDFLLLFAFATKKICNIFALSKTKAASDLLCLPWANKLLSGQLGRRGPLHANMHALI